MAQFYESGAGSAADGNSHILEEHAHSVQRVYPTLAAPITLIGGAGVYELGAYTEVIPANTIALPFDLHVINVANASQADTYELHLFQGSTGNESLIAQIRFIRPLGGDASFHQNIITPLMAANTRVSARLASKSGGGDIADMSVGYHTY